MKKLLVLSVLLTGLMSFRTIEPTIANYTNTPEQDVLGIWWSENRNQKVEVYVKNGIYYGRILWMKEDDPSLGTQMLDKNNPNTSLRSRRVTGVDMLHHFAYMGDRVFMGRIYDPISGKDYSARITLSKDGRTAYIRGYIMLPMFGRTEICTKD